MWGYTKPYGVGYVVIKLKIELLMQKKLQSLKYLKLMGTTQQVSQS